MEPLPYSLVQDVHYVDAVARELLPKIIFIDHYKTFDEALLKLCTTHINHLDKERANDNRANYYIADAVIVNNTSGQALATLERKPGSKNKQLEVSLTFDNAIVSDPLRSLLLPIQSRDQITFNKYRQQLPPVASNFPKEIEQLIAFQEKHYGINQIFHYRSVHQPTANDGETTPSVEQRFHASTIKEALTWLLLSAIPANGSPATLSEGTLPSHNTIVVDATKEVIADVMLLKPLGTELSGKGLFLSFRSDIAFVEAAYEMPGLKELSKENTRTETFKLAYLRDDNNTLVPLPVILKFRDRLISESQGIELTRYKTHRHQITPDKNPGMKM